MTRLADMPGGIFYAKKWIGYSIGYSNGYSKPTEKMVLVCCFDTQKSFELYPLI